MSSFEVFRSSSAILALMYVNSINKLVVFSIGEQRYALHLSAVERIFRALEITPLPKGPSIVLGVINFQGSILPVINLRRRFRLPERSVGLTDHFIVGRTTKRRLAFVVDSVSDVIDYPSQAIVAAESIVSGTEYIEGVAKLRDGMVLIQDLEKFLSLEEESVIQEAMLHREREAG